MDHPSIDAAPPSTPPQGVALGRLVRFVVSEGDARAIKELAQPGNDRSIVAGEIRAGIITRIWNAEQGMVNLHVLLDGPSTFWATSVSYHDRAGEQGLVVGHSWHWPERV